MALRRLLATRATAALLRRPHVAVPPPLPPRAHGPSPLGGGSGAKRRMDDHYMGDKSRHLMMTPVAVGCGAVLLAAASGGLGFVLGVIWCVDLLQKKVHEAMDKKKMEEAAKAKEMASSVDD
ncbi:hypothetical protein ACP4OV_011777 [Aristida adscensionis]